VTPLCVRDALFIFVEEFPRGRVISQAPPPEVTRLPSQLRDPFLFLTVTLRRRRRSRTSVLSLFFLARRSSVPLLSGSFFHSSTDNFLLLRVPVAISKDLLGSVPGGIAFSYGT